MGRGKGPEGKNFRTFVHDIMPNEGTVSPTELFKLIQDKSGDAWTEDSIWRGLMMLMVNLAPSYQHWPRVSERERIIFNRDDGYFEFYDERKHGKFVNGLRTRR